MKQFKQVTLLLTIGLFAFFFFGSSANVTEAAVTYKTGHLWRFTYNHDSVDPNNISGEVAVQVVKYNRYTLDVVMIYSEEIFPVPCAINKSNGGVDCELDIKANIDETYAIAGFNYQAPTMESYDEFIVEATGSWTGAGIPNPTTMVSHPTFEYGLQTTGSKVRFLTGLAGSSTKGHSDFYKPNPGDSYRMTTLFRPTLTNQIVEYYVEDVQSGKEGSYGTETLPSSDVVDFLLAPSIINITVPNGFELETFVIDPPRFGQG